MKRKWYKIPKEIRQVIGLFLLTLATVTVVFSLSYLGAMLTLKFLNIF